MKNRALSSLPLVLLASSLSLACACGGSQSPPPNTASTTTTTQGTAPRSEASLEHADTTGLLLRAAYDTPLTEMQKTKLDELRSKLEASGQPIAMPLRSIHADLAAGARAGAIDRGKIQSDESAFESAVQSHVETEIDTLNALHDALDANQRRVVADAVRTKMNARAAKMEASVTSEWKTKKVDHATSELGLDGTQRGQLVAILDSASDASAMHAKAAERRARVDALLAAFEGSVFDAKSLVSPKDAAKMARDHVDHEVAMKAQLVSILRPDQRQKLAASLESKMIDHPQSDEDDD